MEFKPFARKFTSYRNIATCVPTQNLFDDLISPEYYSHLQRHETLSSAIDHSQSKLTRPFQYGDTQLSLYVFEKLNWSYGRFSDGIHFGVWYGSLEEETSIHEVLYHRLQEAKDLFANPKVTDPSIVHQRVMLKAKCRTKALVDLTQEKEIQNDLVSNEYAYCQQLGERAVKEKIDAFLTPSARRKKGICTPVFNSQVIQDEFIYYFDLIIYRDFRVQFSKAEIRDLSVPDFWNLSPQVPASKILPSS